MLSLSFAVAAVATMAILSLRANRRYRSHPRLPMQWTLRGNVIWRAPRPLARGGIPAHAARTHRDPPHPPPKALLVTANQPDYALILVALGFLAAHLLHLWLIARTLRHRPG
ncbi:hypothetical protein [Polymorphobacter sp.]|uniref:hypothetical protein n=1 Tax=Polymorphobacter sp. TaxID=1909290 RepID=UPI003F6F8515